MPYCGGRLWCPVEKGVCREQAGGHQWVRRGCALADRCALLLTWEMQRGRQCAGCRDSECRDRERVGRRADNAAQILAKFPELGQGLQLQTREG